MGEPKEVTSVSGALQELISAYSALDMPPRPIVKNDQELDTQIHTDFWIQHAGLHLEKVIAFIHSINKDVYPETQVFYFTFMIGDEVNGRNFLKIHAVNYSDARNKMMERFGNKWAFQYPAEEWFASGVPQDKLYGYKEIF